MSQNQAGAGTAEIEQKLRAEVVPFFDEPTNTFSYIVQDPASRSCAVIDCVMNLDYPSGAISYEGADEMIAYIRKRQLQLEWILETHVHADHLSAAPYIREQLGGRIAICSAVTVVQKTFSTVFNSGPEFLCDGSDFDVLLDDGDDISIGSLTAYAMHTPGHTPACMSFVYGDAVFIGDTLFMPDGGTARADFPGGDASILYQSIRRILDMPEANCLYVCHDYCPNGRAVEYQTTVGDQLRDNIHVSASVTQNDFVEMREKRDAGLEMPTLILPSLQVNMRAGQLPAPEPTGQVFLKLPINAFADDSA